MLAYNSKRARPAVGDVRGAAARGTKVLGHHLYNLCPLSIPARLLPSLTSLHPRLLLHN